DVDEKDQQELLIKASIVEKEVPEQYRPQVARVIENRLEGCSGDKTLGMDTTLVYAFGKQYSETREKERDESPFNTRKNPGLPPPPTASPSTNAIDAALDPARGNWCYLVTVDLETEETVCTDDIDEHNKNQERYREYLEELRSEPNDEGQPARRRPRQPERAFAIAGPAPGRVRRVGPGVVGVRPLRGDRGGLREHRLRLWTGVGRAVADDAAEAGGATGRRRRGTARCGRRS